MKHVVPHNLDLQTSRRVTERAWETYRDRFSQYNPTLVWATERRATVGFRAKGIGLSGHLELLEGSIEIDLDVPFLLRPFRAKALEVIEREIRHWVAQAQAGEF